MSVFESVKAAVTLRQAAETYGLELRRNGMTCCPFHEDKHPSLKLNEDYFYCFGCGASGDVIDFTARLFGLSPYDAARRLAGDFGIDPAVTPVPIQYPRPRQNQSRLDELRCRRAMTDYLHLQQRLVRTYAPKTPSSPYTTQFVTACQQRDRVMGLLEMLDETAPTERKHAVEALIADGSVAFWEEAAANYTKEDTEYGNEIA